MKANLTYLVCLLISTLGYTQDNTAKLLERELKKYSIEEALIEYDITGDATGSATRIFQRFGWQEEFLTSFTIKKYGTEDHTEIRELSLGDYIYTLKGDNNQGTKKKDSRISELLSYKTRRESIDAIMTIEGGTKSGVESMLDRECVKWVFTKGIVKELYEWEGIPLKIVKHLPGISYSITATKITSDPPSLDDQSFSLPENVSFN